MIETPVCPLTSYFISNF